MTANAAITLERCTKCAATWSLPRGFCPHCGSQAVHRIDASGRGRLFASTLVHRAPSAEFRYLTPYRIALVTLEEGPRLMAHLADDVRIGEAVIGTIETVGERSIPVFRCARRPEKTQK